MSDRIGVLELLPTSTPGGGPKHVYDLVRELPKSEFEVVVGAPRDGIFFGRFQVLGLRVVEFPRRRLGLGHLLLAIRLIRQVDIAIVHTHGKGPGLYGRLAAWWTGASAVHTFHGIHYAISTGPTARTKRTLWPHLLTTVRERVCLLALCGLAWLAGPAFAEPLYEWQWTVPPGILLSNQAPTIAALPDGALLVCWVAGSTEKARDVQIYCSRSGPGSSSWERPRPVVQRGEHAQGSWLRNLTLGNPVLFLDHQRHLWLFYAAVDAPLGWSGSHVDYKVSSDMGKTWGSSRRLVAGWGNLPRNSALALGSDGRVLLPVYHELFGIHGYVLELKIGHGAIEKVESRRIPGGDHLQPALVWAEPRRVVAYLRSASSRVPHVLRSEYDHATTQWSKPEALALPNSKSAIDAVNTSDGGILLAYNDSPTHRTPLSLAYSRDSRRFTKIWDFERAPDLRFSYPALIRAADGMYHLVYRAQESWAPAAIKHVMFNQEWLTLRLRAAGIPPAGIPKGH